MHADTPLADGQSPTAQEHSKLLEEIGPLPLEGPAWPRRVKWLAWVVLAVLARYMHTSVTRITEKGIEQTWMGRREIAWEDISFVKFIPLIASKKLICFTKRGRPVTFQAGSRELEIAFARIALVYRRH